MKVSYCQLCMLVVYTELRADRIVFLQDWVTGLLLLHEASKCIGLSDVKVRGGERSTSFLQVT